MTVEINEMCNKNISKYFYIKRLTFVFLMLALTMLNWTAEAQSSKKLDKMFNDAKKQYSIKNYTETIEICNKILSDEPEFNGAHLLLADLYNEVDSARLEIFHLNKAGEFSNDSLIFFRLGEAYYSIGNYSEALSSYNKYSNYRYISEKRQFLLACKIASCKFAIHSIKNPVEFDPKNMGDRINTSYDEYWPTPSLDGKKLVFTRLIKNSNQRPQEDFYMAKMDSNNWDQATPITEVNTLDNEGAQTLSSDSKILFFTACNRPDGMGSCDIYFSRFMNEKWSTPVNAGSLLNTQSWDAQPSLSSDNRYLYFSSNRIGGKGKKDIWRAELLRFSDAGLPIWKEPENLGDIINTPGDEISPFIHANNSNFYFASDNHVGMGGMDIFSAEIEEFGSVTNLKNMGYPINTHEDELGLTISSIGETAYFSSARNSKTGLDIFTFNLSRGLRPKPVTYVKAKVVDGSSKLPIQANIELANLSSKPNQLRIEDADENGEVMLCLPLGRNYAFNVSEPGFLFFSKSLLLADSNSLSDPYILDIVLEPIEIGAEMELYNIYYETDLYEILPESEPELQKLVSFLKNNSQLKVEIQGHTDSSGNAENNKQLSEFRAKSVVDYLIANEIQISRLSHKGYGDTVPIASNETIEGRRLNRRTTIKIIEK